MDRATATPATAAGPRRRQGSAGKTGCDDCTQELLQSCSRLVWLLLLVTLELIGGVGALI